MSLTWEGGEDTTAVIFRKNIGVIILEAPVHLSIKPRIYQFSTQYLHARRRIDLLLTSYTFFLTNSIYVLDTSKLMLSNHVFGNFIL